MTQSEGLCVEQAAKQGRIFEVSERPNQGREANSLLSDKDNAIKSAR
jgi:hypothetical protein